MHAKVSQLHFKLEERLTFHHSPLQCSIETVRFQQFQVLRTLIPTNFVCTIFITVIAVFFCIHFCLFYLKYFLLPLFLFILFKFFVFSFSRHYSIIRMMVMQHHSCQSTSSGVIKFTSQPLISRIVYSYTFENIIDWGQFVILLCLFAYFITFFVVGVSAFNFHYSTVTVLIILFYSVEHAACNFNIT